MKHDIDKISALLASAEFFSGAGIYYFEEIESTNSWLLERCKRRGQSSFDGRIDGKICLTEKQSYGKGRRGKSWLASASSSVLLSLGWRLRESRSPGLSLVSGLAVVQALQELGVNGVKLKWPNDIIADGKKLGGILVEISALDCVIGVGINVNIPRSFDMQIERPWTDLHTLGFRIDRDQLVAAIVLNHERFLSRYSGAGFSPFMACWNVLHAYQHQAVEVVSAGCCLSGTALGVDENGAFLLESGGFIRRIMAGDVSIYPKS